VTQEVETTLRDKDNPRHIVEARVRTKSGSYLTMEFSGAPYEQGGRVVGILGIARDITEHKRLEQALLDVSEREQRRIGQDLHDGLCQHLAGVSFMTKVLAQKLAAERQADADEAKKIAELVRQAAGAARTIAAGLHPVKMEAHGAMDALQELARLTGDMFKVECRFHCDPPVLIADNRKAVHLYRIAQEAIHNAVTHGKATHIQMTLTAIRRRGGKITFTVKDDGVGLPDPLPPTRGMGLDIMRHRAQAIGGALDIRRGTEGGTVLTCSFVPSPPTNPEDNHGQQQQSHSS
jgi:signal transduction histidine kinase